jgi:hypothetical protein
MTAAFILRALTVASVWAAMFGALALVGYHAALTLDRIVAGLL